MGCSVRTQLTLPPHPSLLQHIRYRALRAVSSRVVAVGTVPGAAREPRLHLRSDSVGGAVPRTAEELADGPTRRASTSATRGRRVPAARRVVAVLELTRPDSACQDRGSHVASHGSIAMVGGDHRAVALHLQDAVLFLLLEIGRLPVEHAWVTR